MLYKAHVKDEKPTFHSNIATIYTTIAVERIKKKTDDQTTSLA